MNAMNIIFLDIDGVLNGHDWDQGAMSTRIQYRCIRQLNRIIKATGAKVVLSSAWRYMLLKLKRSKPPAMTLTGFEYLMRTHGTCGFRLLGTTASDEEFGFPGVDDECRRARQVRKWLVDHGWSNYVCIDDEDFGFTRMKMQFVQTNGKWGLSRRNADKAIRILKYQECQRCKP